MLDADKFLPDILSNPDDDAPRMVYADWLSERGDPRGEFILVQCEIPNCAGGAKLRKLKQREKELLSVHRRQWSDRVLNLLARDPQFRRGFVDEVTMSVRGFIKNGKEILSCTPLMQAKLTAGPNRMKKLGECDALSRLRHLELSKNHMGPENLGHLLESPHLANLTSLSLRTCKLGDEGARLLGDCSQLSKLNFLDIANNQIYGGLAHLANSEHLENLTKINLTYNFLNSQAGQTICDARWQQLKHLDLSGNTLGSAVVEAMSVARNLTELEYLDLSFCEIKNEGAQAFANSDSFPKLNTLSFNGNGIGDSGVKAFAESELITQLTDLRLSQCELTITGIQTLLDSPNWNPKTKLYLGINQLSDSGIRKVKEQYGKSFGMEEQGKSFRTLRR